MGNAPYVQYECTSETFRPCILYPVRWLDWALDFELARASWGEEPESFAKIWQEARGMGYHYAAIIEQERIVALAASWQFSDTAWELAAVHVQDSAYYRRGYGKSVSSFITAAILAAGRLASCTTDVENVAMQRTAESIGYQRCP